MLLQNKDTIWTLESSVLFMVYALPTPLYVAEALMVSVHAHFLIS